MSDLTYHERMAIRGMAAAQYAYDNAAEPEYSDDWLTPDQADEAARDDIISTPYHVSLWLAEECHDDTRPLNGYRLGEALTQCQRVLCVPELLTVLMTQPQREAMCALYVLRDIFAAAHAGEADAAAKAMLAAQQAQADLWADEAQEDVL